MPPLTLDIIYHGDCLDILKTFPSDSVDALVTDPPSGASILGLTWDKFKAQQDKLPAPVKKYLDRCDPELVAFQEFLYTVMREVFRVLKPGAHGLVWALPRTAHHTTMALERAGFEIRDKLDHVFGSGMPKSLNVGKAVDKLCGADPEQDKAVAAYVKERRETLGFSVAQVDQQVFGGTTRYSWVEGRNNEHGQFAIYLPTPEEWPRLKACLDLDDRYDAYIRQSVPSREMRSRVDGGKSQLVGTEEGNFGYQQDGERWTKERRITEIKTEQGQVWSGWGTGLKPSHEDWVLIRKPLQEPSVAKQVLATKTGAINIDASRVPHASEADFSHHKEMVDRIRERGGSMANSWKNCSDLSGANEVTSAGRWPANTLLSHAESCRGDCAPDCPVSIVDEQGGLTATARGVSRYFTAFPFGADEPLFLYCPKPSPSEKDADAHNTHPTVKSLALMRWLVHLITPKDGLVLDPFIGSGTTAVAAVQEGAHFVGIEQNAEYLETARTRASKALTIARDEQIYESNFDIAASLPQEGD